MCSVKTLGISETHLFGQTITICKKVFIPPQNFWNCLSLTEKRIKKKGFILTDRNILVDQSIQQDFSPLEKTIHKINFTKDDPVTITFHEVYFSLYQQLAGNEENEDEGTGEEAV